MTAVTRPRLTITYWPVWIGRPALALPRIANSTYRRLLLRRLQLRLRPSIPKEI